MQRTRPGRGNQIEERHAQIEEKRRIRTREVDEITGLPALISIVTTRGRRGDQPDDVSKSQRKSRIGSRNEEEEHLPDPFVFLNTFLSFSVLLAESSIGASIFVGSWAGLCLVIGPIVLGSSWATSGS